MHQADIYSNERDGNVGQTVHGVSGGTKRVRLGSISVRSISMCVLAFMIGRVSLIGGLSPFGAAFFAASYGGGVSPVAIAVSTALGALTWSTNLAVAFEIITITTLFGILSIFARWARVQGEFVNGLNVFASVFLVRAIPLAFKFLLYDFILSIFEALVTVMLYILLKKGTTILLEDNKRNIFNTEEVISLAFIASLVIAGIRDFGVFGTELKSIVCILIVLVLARAKGAGIGAASGVVMGLVSSLTGTANFNVIGSYAFSGLLAGLFRKLGSIGVVLGFITGNAVLTYFTTGSTEVLIQLRDIAVASVIFYLMPKKVVNRAGRIFEERSIGLERADEIHLRPANMAVQKLNAFSKAVEELAVSFNKVPQPEQEPGEHDIASFFDTIAERVCKDCSLCLYCWDRKFNDTYQAMFSMLEALERRGRLSADHIPACFSNDCCARPKELVSTMNSLYEVYRVNQMWRKKISESRGLVAQQLQGVSRMIAQLATEIDSETSHKSDMESKILSELEMNGFSISEVNVENSSEEDMDVDVYSRGCPGVKKCRSQMDEIVSRAAGKRMVRRGFLCNPEAVRSRCMIRFTSTQTYGVTVGVSRVNKHNNRISGDSYTFMELKDKKYILGLSDGMGSGETAARNSQIAVDLLEKFLESGFDRDIAVKLINSALVLKSAGDSYATMDISAIDLHSGKVEFVKIGSPPAYIKKRDKTEIVKGASLPAGILDNIEMDLSDSKVNAGDFIVMVTDGVIESGWDNLESGDWIADFLEEVHTSNPQQLADLIAGKALENYGDRVNDDMTVLVAKVWEKV